MSSHRRSGVFGEYISLSFLLLVAVLLLFIATAWQAKLIPETKDLWTFEPKIWAEFVRELGFACIIAWMVSITVEQSSRRRQENAAEEMQRKIADNVFRGVYSEYLPGPLIDTMTNSMLQIEFVRESLDLTYEFNETEKDAILVDVHQDYTIRNVTPRKSKLLVQFGIDDPFDPKLRDQVKLKSLEINGKKIENIPRAINDRFRTIDYEVEHEVESRELVRIRASYAMVKQSVDTIVFGAIYPTLKISMNAVGLKNKRLTAHALYHEKFTRVAGEGNEGLHRWVLDDVVLPNQGIVLFWDSGKPEGGFATGGRRNVAAPA